MLRNGHRLSGFRLLRWLLNEVLSLNAQEYADFAVRVGCGASSMKS